MNTAPPDKVQTVSLIRHRAPQPPAAPQGPWGFLTQASDPCICFGKPHTIVRCALCLQGSRAERVLVLLLAFWVAGTESLLSVEMSPWPPCPGDLALPGRGLRWGRKWKYHHLGLDPSKDKWGCGVTEQVGQWMEIAKRKHQGAGFLPDPLLCLLL